MKRIFMQFTAQPGETGAGSGGQQNIDQKIGGEGNAQGSGANEQADASRGSSPVNEKVSGYADRNRTGFETSTSSGKNEKTEEEARTTTQPDYKAGEQTGAAGTNIEDLP